MDGDELAILPDDTPGGETSSPAEHLLSARSAAEFNHHHRPGAVPVARKRAPGLLRRSPVGHGFAARTTCCTASGRAMELQEAVRVVLDGNPDADAIFPGSDQIAGRRGALQLIGRCARGRRWWSATVTGAHGARPRPALRCWRGHVPGAPRPGGCRTPGCPAIGWRPPPGVHHVLCAIPHPQDSTVVKVAPLATSQVRAPAPNMSTACSLYRQAMFMVTPLDRRALFRPGRPGTSSASSACIRGVWHARPPPPAASTTCDPSASASSA